VPADLSMTNRRAHDRADIVLGEDWDRPMANVDNDLRKARQRRGWVSLNRSPLARKIILFNLMAMVVLVAGVLYLNPFRDSLVAQREGALAAEAQLIADIFEASLPETAPANLLTRDGVDADVVLGRIGLRDGIEVFVYDASKVQVTSTQSVARTPARPIQGLDPRENGTTLITDFLNAMWSGMARLLTGGETPGAVTTAEDLAYSLLDPAAEGATVIRRGDAASGTIYAAASPISGVGGTVGVVVVTTAAGEIDDLVRMEREQLLQMFAVALLVSIVLSLVLASTVANPISDLAAAAELGRDKNARKMSPTRVRIPDLTGRPDEIGRLSGALRGMIGALYDRIDSNEQFAADVSHELKNPLTSLRSAVETLPLARTEQAKSRLLEIIQHDVQRLDRLITDISDASRLDAELARDVSGPVDLRRLLDNFVILQQTLGDGDRDVAIELTVKAGGRHNGDFLVNGHAIRIGQVIANLVDNARSFVPETGGRIHLTLRRDGDQAEITICDNGPGIRAEKIDRIFERFYTDRPEEEGFGQNSGLGLSISRQIIEAHGGKISAYNRKPPESGACFVVRLPVR